MASSSKKDNDATWWQPSLILFMRLSGWIGGPVIIALFVGKWLDDKYSTEPWLFLTTVGLAFITSSIGIAKEASEAIKKMSQDDKQKKPDSEEDK